MRICHYCSCLGSAVSFVTDWQSGCRFDANCLNAPSRGLDWPLGKSVDWIAEAQRLITQLLCSTLILSLIKSNSARRTCIGEALLRRERPRGAGNFGKVKRGATISRIIWISLHTTIDSQYDYRYIILDKYLHPVLLLANLLTEIICQSISKLLQSQLYFNFEWN